MQNVRNFYFKDETNLYINSNDGIYNSKTLSMKFRKNVKANYLDKELISQNADYDNEKVQLKYMEMLIVKMVI